MTSRATQPSTGAVVSHIRVPSTRPVKTPAISRCRWAGWSESTIGQHLVELGVALADAGLHAAGQPGVTALEAVDQGLGVQPGAAIAEVLEPQRLQCHAVGLALEGEGLHDPVGTHFMEGAVEA